MKKLRTTALLLACLMLVSCMSITAMAEVGPNLVVNGTFDTDMEGWSSVGQSTWQDGYVTIPASASATFSQAVPNPVAGEKYLFSFDGKNEGAGAGILVYIYWGFDNQSSSVSSGTATVTNWTNFRTILIPPEGATSATITFRNPDGMKQASIDNVTFCHVPQDATMFDFNNFDMETLNADETFPVYWTATGNAALETTKVFEGNNAIKLSNTESTETSSVSLSFSLPKDETWGFEEFYLNYRLEDTNFTEGATAEGAKMSLPGSNVPAWQFASGKETAYFTKEFAEGDGWRQMMVYAPSRTNSNLFTITVELTGIATLYIDNLVYNHTDYVVNAGFQGLYADGIAAGWMPQEYDLNNWKDTANNYLYLEETLNQDGKTYENVAKVTSAYSWTNTGLRMFLGAAETVLNVGTVYEYAFDFVNGDKGNPTNAPQITEIGGAEEVTTTNALVAAGGDGRKCFYVKYQGDTSGRLRLGVRFRSGNAPMDIDNVTFRPITQDEMTFTKDGEEATSVEPGDTITATFIRPGVFDGTTPEKEYSVVAAVYKKNGESAPTLTDIFTFTTAQAEKVFATTTVIMQNALAVNGAGHVPAKASISLDVPEAEGEYFIKAFAFDSVSLLTPIINATLGVE
ncbi:MAG: hypothetical protein E7408_06675 [Ruminococcaceae bacterium]|nr:hypothetical protein [Oscillospiraceae bacterium]